MRIIKDGIVKDHVSSARPYYYEDIYHFDSPNISQIVKGITNHKKPLAYLQALNYFLASNEAEIPGLYGKYFEINNFKEVLDLVRSSDFYNEYYSWYPGFMEDVVLCNYNATFVEFAEHDYLREGTFTSSNREPEDLYYEVTPEVHFDSRRRVLQFKWDETVLEIPLTDFRNNYGWEIKCYNEGRDYYYDYEISGETEIFISKADYRRLQEGLRPLATEIKNLIQQMK